MLLGLFIVLLGLFIVLVGLFIVLLDLFIVLPGYGSQVGGQTQPAQRLVRV